MKHIPTIKEESNIYYLPMRDDDDHIEPKLLKSLKETVKKNYGDEYEPTYVKKLPTKNIK